MADPENYDEFGLFHENAEEWGLSWNGPPAVRRERFEVAPSQFVSALLWGEGTPELVFLHGGGQNAHTWDTVLLALARPAIAIDLPGHGHSNWRDDRDYWPWSNAEAVASVLDSVGARPRVVIGMSLGGLTTIRLCGIRPDLVPAAIIVDVTPSVHSRTIAMTMEERGSTALIAGSKEYDSFDAIFEATMTMSPNRRESAIRRGVLHNSCRLDDGRWRWRYDIGGGSEVETDPDSDPLGFEALWEDVDAMDMPTMLVRGADSVFVLDEHEAEFRRRKPDLRVEAVPAAGHAVQSDQPLVMSRLVEEFVP